MKREPSLVQKGIVAVLCAMTIFAGSGAAQEPPPTLDFQKITTGLVRMPYDSIRMAQGPDGSVYVAGDDYNSDLGFLLKFDSGGNLLWDRAVSPSEGLDLVSGVAVDGNGNAYVPATDFVNNRTSMFKFGADGALAGNVTMSNPAVEYAIASGRAAFDRSRNRLYVSRVFMDTTNDWQYAVALAVYDGNLVLQSSVSVNLGYYGYYGDGSLDSAGNVYLGGYSDGRYVARKYAPGLDAELWSSNAPVSIGGRFYKLYSNAAPNGGLAFWSTSLGGNALVRVSSNGVLFPEMAVNGYGRWDTLALDSQGGVYLRPDDDLVKINTTGEYAWGTSVLAQPPDSYLTQAMIGEGDKIYTFGEYYSATEYGLYLARYTQGGVAKKYAISISTPVETQIVTVGSTTVPLVSLVNIFGTTEAAAGIGIDFSISTFPDGAIGQSLTKSNEATNPGGLADVQLRLSNIPAEYGVTAECPSCVPEASSVTFKCCGKLPNDDFKQSSSTWASKDYDNICSTAPATTSSTQRPVYSCDAPIFNNPTYQKYRFTIRAKGCGLSALATLINYYRDVYSLPISSTTPFGLNKYLNDSAGYAVGAVDFKSVERFSGQHIKFVGTKTIGKQGVTKDILLRDINKDILTNRPVIIRVPGHFMLVTGKCGNKYIVSDPGPTAAGNVLYDPNGTRPLTGIRQFQR